jgi:hypothetical protein
LVIVICAGNWHSDKSKADAKRRFLVFMCI